MKKFLLLGTILSASVLPSAALAQDAGSPPSSSDPSTAAPSNETEEAPAGGLGEIVVTAQRREENLQRAALAISAISGDDLAAAGVSRPTELTSVIPSLQVAPAAGPYNLFYLRGVGNFNGNAFSDSAIAFNADGVFIGRPSSTTGFFYDLERVEVLKGPQGTLYGRNATGGAINVISRKPELGSFGGSASAEYGNYDAVRLDATLNAPLGEIAALRVAGIHVSHDGYMNDGTDDQDDWGGRASLRAEPTDTLTIDVVADYFTQGGVGVGSTPLASVGGIPLPTNFKPEDRIGFLSAQGQAFYAAQPNTLLGRTFTPITLRPFQDNEYWGISSTINWESSFGTLTVVPAYRESSIDFLNFLPGFFIRQQEKSNQKSLETRFQTDDSKALRLLIGGFIYDENTRDPVVAYEHQSNVNIQNFEVDTASQALFGRLTYAITPEIRLTAGGRYTWEQKDFDGLLQSASRICVVPTTFFPSYVPGCPGAQPIPYELTIPAPNFVPFPNGAGTITTAPSIIDNTGANARHVKFDQFTYRLGADWDIGARNLLYASYETGFKSGGFFFSSDAGIYQPETIKAWTLGSKNRFLDNRLQVNLEAFYWRYRDQQISHVGLDSAGISIF
ncbi:MAG TPA: TonB-dependent receptor, partial [Reyranella sp.]|nr:TonB-dependent receptor [Reyranella sp.]